MSNLAVVYKVFGLEKGSGLSILTRLVTRVLFSTDPWGHLSVFDDDCQMSHLNFRDAPDPFNFLRHVMRAIWSV